MSTEETTEVNGTIAGLEEEELLEQIENVKLEGGGKGKGKLRLTNKRIEFENKGGLFSSSHVQFSIELYKITSAKTKNSTLILEWPDEENKPVVKQLHMPKGVSPSKICQNMNGILKFLRYEIEQTEQRESYQEFLWKAAYHMWGTVDLLLRVVRELSHEDWEAVDASLAEARDKAASLAAEGRIDIMDTVQTLIATSTSRDAPLVLKSVISTLKSIGTSLNNGSNLSGEWGDLPPEDPTGMNWTDLRYVFLFASRYRLLSLWHQLGETKKIKDSQPQLDALLSILADRFPIETQVTDTSTDEASGIISPASRAAHKLEYLLKSKAGAS